MNKKAMMELVQGEIIKLVIAMLIGSFLLYHIYSAVSGEDSILLSKSRENALWIDAAMNSEDFADSKLFFVSDLEDFSVENSISKGMFNIKKEGAPFGKNYRLVSNPSKNIKIDNETYFVLTGGSSE